MSVSENNNRRVETAWHVSHEQRQLCQMKSKHERRDAERKRKEKKREEEEREGGSERERVD